MRLKHRWRGAAGWMLAACLAPGLAAQTQIDLPTQAKRIDFTAAPSTKPAKMGTSLPLTCAIGELFFKSNAPAGQNLYGCAAANAWVILSGAGTPSPNAPPTNDMRVTKTTAVQLTIGDGCSPADPCNIRIGSYVIAVTAPMAANISAGSGAGLARIYITEAGVPLVDHSTSAGLTVVCSGGCASQQSVAPAYPLNAIPLAEVSITAGQWDVVTDRRSLLHNRAFVAGQGIVVNEVAGIATLEIDPADVARQGGTNDWTGANDFSLSTVFRVQTGTGVPSTALCSAAAHVGRVYVRNDAGVSNASLYSCSNTGAGVFGWELSGPDAPSGWTAITEEFLPQAGGPSGWSVTGTLSFPSASSDRTHPGVVRALSAATVDAAARLQLDGGSEQAWVSALNEAAWEALFVFRIGGVTSQYQFRAGFVDASTLVPSNGIWARLSNSTGCGGNNQSDTAWQFESRSSGTSTVAASTAPAAEDDWVSVRMRSVVNGQVLFSIARNGGAYSTEQTVSANIPSGALYPVVSAVNCSGTARSVTADYFAFRRRGIVR